MLRFDEVLAGGGPHGRGIPTGGRTALEAKPEDDLATLIYTSGTTGDPKGVMLSHGNIASNVTTCVDLFSFTAEDECLSFLPLSHIFERMFGHYCMFHAGVVINYAESVDTVPADMLEIRPHLMASVPRLYEKIYARVLDNVRSASAAQKAHLRLGPGRGRALGRGDDRAAPGVPPAAAPACRGGPAGLRQAAGPDRRAHPILHLRAAPRSLPRSRGSSMRRDCRSSRATASPRRRR